MVSLGLVWIIKRGISAAFVCVNTFIFPNNIF